MSLLLTFEIGQHLFRRRHPTPVLLPGKSHGWRSLVGYTVHGIAKSRTRLSDFTFIFSLSCIGEGNGNPLQCSCLENPRDSGAWWAAVYGVAQSRTRLKCLSSSSSSNTYSYTHTQDRLSPRHLMCHFAALSTCLPVVRSITPFSKCSLKHEERQLLSNKV